MLCPANFAPDESGGFVATFRDIPEAITQGDTEEEAREMAQDALITAMDFYFEDRRPVPPPSSMEPGERGIELPLSVAAKVLLLIEMLAQRIRPVDLARQMNTAPQEINRIIDLHHNTKIDRVAEALARLGKRLERVAMQNFRLAVLLGDSARGHARAREGMAAWRQWGSGLQWDICIQNKLMVRSTSFDENSI